MQTNHRRPWLGECNDPSCTHPAPGGLTPSSGPGRHRHPGNDTRHDEYKIGGGWGETCDTACASEKATKLAHKLGQLQPFTAVFPHECMGQLASSGPT
jgi:hypothetical protein